MAFRSLFRRKGRTVLTLLGAIAIGVAAIEPEAVIQLLPMAPLFGGAMLAADHVAAPALLHLAWNWASVIRR
ncbi:MAG: hypothetical protein ACE5JL_17095 [Dehalococcoidia bacterium]